MRWNYLWLGWIIKLGVNSLRTGLSHTLRHNILISKLLLYLFGNKWGSFSFLSCPKIWTSHLWSLRVLLTLFGFNISVRLLQGRIFHLEFMFRWLRELLLDDRFIFIGSFTFKLSMIFVTSLRVEVVLLLWERVFTELVCSLLSFLSCQRLLMLFFAFGTQHLFTLFDRRGMIIGFFSSKT